MICSPLTMSMPIQLVTGPVLEFHFPSVLTVTSLHLA